MHSLTIYFGPTNAAVILLFKEESNAQQIYRVITNAKAESATRIEAHDDYGQILLVEAPQIHAVLFDDMDQSQLAYIERGLHNARAQAKAQQRAAGDPTLRAAAMTQGPAALSPFGGNRMS